MARPVLPSRFSPSARPTRTRYAARALGVLAVATAAVAWHGATGSTEAATPLPAPALDEPAATGVETAVLAGGCFWGVQGVFEHVDGVKRVAAGYAGGAAGTAQYEIVSTGSTGHAESVQIVYDPARITYGRLLQIFFSVAHNPTELNYQGPDHGTQYRSAIFPADAKQAQIAAAYIAQLDRAHVFRAPIVTRIETGKHFYPAEAYHQNFLEAHPDQPYIAINDLPKLDALKKTYPNHYRARPVLWEE